MISWSHSKIADYLQCPFKFREKYIAKTVERRETPEMRNGNEIHTILENAVNATPDGVARNIQAITERGLMHVIPIVNRFRDLGATAELQLGVRVDWSPCGFWDKDVYGRGKVDVLAANDRGGGLIADWKTGKTKNKKYQTPDELKLHALLVKSHFPEIQSVNGFYIYTQDGSYWPERQAYNLSAFSEERSKVDELMGRIEFAAKQDKFGTRKNNLCQGCEVKHCKHYKARDK